MRRNFVTKHQAGVFFISADMLENEPYKLKLIMSKVVVVRCELLHIRNGFKYQAYSPLFEPVKDGYLLPEYDISVCPNNHVHIEKIEFGKQVKRGG